jgi:hypothetical protein
MLIKISAEQGQYIKSLSVFGSRCVFTHCVVGMPEIKIPIIWQKHSVSLQSWAWV